MEKKQLHLQRIMMPEGEHQSVDRKCTSENPDKATLFNLNLRKTHLIALKRKRQNKNLLSFQANKFTVTMRIFHSLRHRIFQWNKHIVIDVDIFFSVPENSPRKAIKRNNN